jgi:ABC-type branched-subunit amino acid transport system ATPase component
MMTEPLLMIDNVEKRYGDIVALRRISAQVLSGSITAFVGPNGAGKTTLFHTISGDLHLDGGRIIYRDRIINGMAPWRIARLGLGRLYQDVRIFENLSVIENTLLALHDHPCQSALVSLVQWPFSRRISVARREAAETFLLEAGVEPPFDRPAKSLSFGNKKLLALARLIAGGFDMLLLDEPTSGLAPQMISKVADVLRNLVKTKGVTIAVIEHNVSFVEEFADITYVLRAGEIFDKGPSHEVLGKEENRELLIGL